ncbi:radical SAM protein [Candidatus Woesearchaeota archaeon]|nr:radical SAM protein [Candidatus Woesearchaeota archaeon]MBW3021577.1 radical SAM protein [Candidatus Woesearchaeota archaeon]
MASIFKNLGVRVGAKITEQLMMHSTPKGLVKAAGILKAVSPARHKPKIEFVRQKFRERHCALMFALKVLKEIRPNFRKKLVNNLIINGMLLSTEKRDAHKSYGNNIPFTLLMSPTMRCNFKCKGCYAADYDPNKEMSVEKWDSIIDEAKKLGVGLFTVLGGEPFVRKDDLLYLMKKHNDAYFQIYTNGALLNNSLIDEIEKLGNVLITFSIEGFEKETDERRHPGTFKRLMEVMDEFKRRKIPFGYSCCVTRKNYKQLLGDEFLDFIISKGAYVGWHFMYMPIGKCPTTDLMLTPEQRKYMGERMKYIRNNKPLFVIDFWNDAPFVGGCIAGLDYVHVDAEGFVEPCIFTHFATDNVKEKKLVDAFNSKYMRAIRKRRYYNKNLYTPCMLVDNPGKLKEIHEEADPKPTHPDAMTILNELKPAIQEYSEGVKKVFEQPWQEYVKQNPKILQDIEKYDKWQDSLT